VSSRTYNDVRLRSEYPRLARAFEEILLTNKEVGTRLRYLYYSKYKTSKRKGKALSLARIIKEVELGGFSVDIQSHETIEKIKTNS